MYAQSPCSTCSLVSGHQHLQESISTAAHCGSLAQVVYIPVPVFMSSAIRKCPPSSCSCAHAQRLDFMDGSQCKTRRRSEDVLCQSRCAYRRKSISKSSLNQKCDTHDTLHHSQQQKTRKVSLCCEHVNDEVFDSSREKYFEFNHGMMMCPAVIGGCCASRMNGQRSSTVKCHSCNNVHMEPTSPVKLRKMNDAKTRDTDTIPGLRAHRRLSADSGRVTWSESGESVYSDMQPAESSRRMSTTATSTSVTTSQSQFSSTSTVNTNTKTRIEMKKRTRRVSDDDQLLSRSANFSYGKSNVRASSQHSKEIDRCRNIPLFLTQSSVCTLSEVQRSNVRRIQHHGQPIPEAFEQPRPRRIGRSQSLFAEPTNFEKSPFVSPIFLKQVANMSVRELPKTVDFTTWVDVRKSREIGGATNGKEDIKAYGLTSLPQNNGFVLTDADKVKIKLYGPDGKLMRSFGTPTWPRYGRGVTLTPNKKYIAVCHLSEICIYTLEGVVRDRFVHENFTACWGIVCDNEGNFVITDPKSSSVFIMSQNGVIINQIGDNTVRCAPTKRTTRRNGISWKKSEKRRTRKREQHISESIDSSLSNVSIPIRIGLRNADNVVEKSDAQVRLLAPRYVAVNSKNQILVTDTRQRSLLCFQRDGTQLFSIGGGRTGCGKCSNRKVPCEKRIVTTRYPSTGLMNSSGSLNAIESTWTDRLSPEMIQNKSRSFNFISDICNPRVGMCKAKNGRAKVLGTMYRGYVGRNESVESAEYQAQQSKRSLEGDSSDSTENGKCSASIGSRLHSYSDKPKEMCSSYIDLAENEKTRGKNSNPIHRLTKSIKKPLWRRRQPSKKTEDFVMKSLSDEMIDKKTASKLSPLLSVSRTITPLGTGLVSPRSTLWHTPDTATTVFTYDSDNKKISPLPLQNEKYLFEENMDDYSIISMESSQGDEYEDESDGERAACRRCHVEDPRGVCVDENDNILLVDRARNRVTLFNPDGHFVRHLLTEKDCLNEPMTVCVLHDNSLAITDSSACVKIFEFNI